MERRRRHEDTALIDVPLASLSPTTFADQAEPDQYAAFITAATAARDHFKGRVVWNVNSTPKGGGVAEMLRPLLGYIRGVGVDARWRVIQGDPAFFRVTKRIHNHLHGVAGDEGELGDAERSAYEAALAPNARELAALLRPEDIVILHDPQTAGLVPTALASGASVVWRCHVGADVANEVVRGAWRFLAPFLQDAHAYVFSRPNYVWDSLDSAKVRIIAPSIDIFSAKNRHLDTAEVDAILAAARIVHPERGARAPHHLRSPGSSGRVDRTAGLVGAPLPVGAPLVVQVSRWDHLKDPAGVLDGFVDRVAPRHPDAHLALVGPEVAAVSDDPEGAVVLAEMSERWHHLSTRMRERVHLVTLPMGDIELNAIMVNAVQRYASVVVQKSLAEGFGLTVAEAMWKARPVVGSRVGGIQDQIEDRVTGLLVDPVDPVGYGAAVSHLLSHPEEADALGRRAREYVRAHFLGPRHLLQYYDLVGGL